MLLVLQLQIQNICPFPLTTSSSNPIIQLGKIIDKAEAKYHYITMNYLSLYKIVQSKTNMAIMQKERMNSWFCNLSPWCGRRLRIGPLVTSSSAKYGPSPSIITV